jgi:uncharacterized repeat protein (TIGR01451 family)
MIGQDRTPDFGRALGLELYRYPRHVGNNPVKGEFMRVGKGMLAVKAAILFFVLAIAGSSAAFGQNCSSAPNYSPDFSSNQGCLTLNGINYATPSTGYPSFQAPIAPAPPNVSSVLQLTPAASYWAGSAWYQTPQPVANPFTTTFTFQLNPAGGADGIAFVIQNSGTSALGAEGCGEGFGADFPPSSGGCTPVQGPQAGIPNSVAIRFNSFSQGVGGGTLTNDPGVNNVTIQSCPGMAANSITAACQLGVFSFPQADFSDGNVHTATITYLLTPTAAQTSCTVNNVPGSCLDVILDGTDLFPTGVPFDMTSIGLSSGAAYVGFTGATGGVIDNQDVLSWTFTPQGQTQTVQPNTPTTFSFQNNAYNYAVTLNGSATTTTITPILTTTAACDALVQQTYPGAHCFVYTGLTPNPDSAVMFEVTCPNLPNEECNPYTAQLETAFTLSPASGVNMFNPVDPFPGWLKGFGGVAAHPCTPPSSGPLFQSDQISIFDIDTKTKGNSGGTGSCWVATYNQPDQVPPPIAITSPTNTAYAQNAPVIANYSCSANYKPASSPVGPYLTIGSCTQSTGTQSGCVATATGLACTGSVNTSTPGTFSFQVNAIDTGLNQNTQSVSYSVVAPTKLQIANLASPGPIANGGTITYLIGVADAGPANANGVIVTDPLPSNTKFVSGSGSNVACSIINKRLSCTTTPISCSAAGNNVTCGVGMLAPLSISSLNGGVLTIKAQVISQPATTCGKKPCTIDTAAVSAVNTDTNANPTATAQTIW